MRLLTTSQSWIKSVKFIAMATTSKEAKWLRNMLLDIKLQ